MYNADWQKRKESSIHQMYRSNSSLEINPDQQCESPLRREYGSHGSIDIMSSTMSNGEMFRQPALPKKSPVPPLQLSTTSSIRSNRTSDGQVTVDGPTPKVPQTSASPRLRLKFHKFWGGGNGVANISKASITDEVVCESFSNFGFESDDRPKRKGFLHYDCQSLLADLGYAATVHGLLMNRRRNTTTGASAASSQQPCSNDSIIQTLPDVGDGVHNDLVEACQFFRNEIGGEEELCVSLSWLSRDKRATTRNSTLTHRYHRPTTAYGLSVLEYPDRQSAWKQYKDCPFNSKQPGELPIELQDEGALYYRNYFYNKDHQNWFGMDDHLGPVAISLKKERIELPLSSTDQSNQQNMQSTVLVCQYRIIVRTSELVTLRGSILEESIPTIKPTNNSKNCNAKDVIEYVAPEISSACLRLGKVGAEKQLLRLDEQGLTKQYKVGVMYCKAGQSTEEEMYNNKSSSQAFDEFLDFIGQTVRLKGFTKYRAGLDNRTDSTGKFSVYTTHKECEIMFHVSTMLPYTENNKQQLLRKRHIGNDIVTIVFQEPGARAFTPKNIRSQFQHVFIVVRAIDPCTENTHYSISVSRSKEVPLFGPAIKDGACYIKGDTFRDLLLSKIINGENAAIQSTKFSTMATRTRQEYLKDLANNYITTTPLDTGQKFSLFSLMKSSSASNMCTSISWCVSRGVSSWCVSVCSSLLYTGGIHTNCIAKLGLAPSVVLALQTHSRRMLLAIPPHLILGWVLNGKDINIYYHQGECFTFKPLYAGDTQDILTRLQQIAPHTSQLNEIFIQRPPSQQLGLQVSVGGVITSVERGGAGKAAGLCRGWRLLEVCKAAVCALTPHQLRDLLTAAHPLTLRVAPAIACTCNKNAQQPVNFSTPNARPQAPGRPRRAYDSDSEGYATGGSGKSGRTTTPPPSSISDQQQCANVQVNTTIPLPQSLEWSALVHTANSVQQQLQEGSPVNISIESTQSGQTEHVVTNRNTWTEGLNNENECECGLRHALQRSGQKVAALQREVERLQRHNQRLRDDGQRALNTLRALTRALTVQNNNDTQ